MALPLAWRWLIIDGWKSHAVPEYLEAALVADLNARTESDGPVTVESKPVVSMTIDQPGMVCMTRPWTKVHLDGLDIEIPCEDVASFINQLEATTPREFTHGDVLGKGMSYVKLHGFCKCIVLTLDLKMLLLEAMREVLMDAEAQATAFYADRMVPSEALRHANADALGIPVDEIPNLGANRQDRFKLDPKKKGEA